MKKSTALLNPLLIAFMAVAKHKSVHAGARAIHISQTAMTQRIHSLEDRLKITLFIRTRQGMQLTAEAEKLLRYCHTVSAYSDETLDDIMNAGKESIQRVKISGPTSIMTSRIIPQSLLVMRQFPQLYISFDINDTLDPAVALSNGLSQFAILKKEDITNDMQIKILNPEKYLLVCSQQWQGRKLKDILQTERIIDFDEMDMASLNYLNHYGLTVHARPERLFVNRTDSLSNMLVQGYGYGVLTKEFSKKYLQAGDLITLNNSKTFDNLLHLAWFARPEPPHYFSALINQIK